MQDTSKIVKRRNKKRLEYVAQQKSTLENFDPMSALLLVMLIVIFVLAVLDLLG
jgi:hypothetical protein